LVKLTAIAVIFFSAAEVTGMPVHDIWFDYVLFMFASAIVGGMPEPDTNLSLPRFLYTWMYRSGHLIVASATAYFLHQRKWESINAGGEHRRDEALEAAQ
jgi:hypothetical protein